MWKRFTRFALLASLLLSPNVASAQSKADKNEARQNAIAGRELFQAGDYAKSMQRFQAAEKLFHASAHLLYIARAQDKLGRLLDARDTYKKLVDETLSPALSPGFKKAQEKSQSSGSKELTQLEGRIPKLSIAVEGPEDAMIFIDGQPAESSQEVDPGEHEVLVTASGWDDGKQTVTIRERDSRGVTIILQQTASSLETVPADQDMSGDALPIPPIIVMGVGVVGLVVGAVTGGVALSKASELNELCPSNPCASENESLKDDANTMGTVSTIGFVAGGVLLAGGGAWLIYELMASPADEPASDEHLTLRFGPGHLGLFGRF
jgi:hypothetical protein